MGSKRVFLSIFAILPEWSKGVDLSSTVLVRVGSNPTDSTANIAQPVERRTFNLVAEGSSPSVGIARQGRFEPPSRA